MQHLTVQATTPVCEDGGCGCDGGGQTCIVIEAEDMYSCNYQVECNTNASGGEVVKLNGCSDGYVKTYFEGNSGTYDLTVNYIDENDGNGQLKVYVNYTLVKTIQLDQQVGDHTNGFASTTIEDLTINTGDKIKIVGYQDCGEYARIDNIEICSTGGSSDCGCDANNTPVDGNETVHVVEDAGIVCLTNALDNASDPDGDALYVKSLDGEDLTVGGDDYDYATGSNGGQFTVWADGTVKFDTGCDFDYLKQGETAETSVTYTVADADGCEVTSTYTVVVDGKSCAPEDGDETAYVKESAGSVCLTNALNNASDADGEALYVKALDGEDLTVGCDDYDYATGSNGGLFTIWADGTVKFDTQCDFDYLKKGESLVTSVTYTVADSSGCEVESTYSVVVEGEGSCGSLGSRVWDDWDRDGKQDWCESGISGVKLELFKWNGYCEEKVDQTYSNANGDYCFDGLDEGWYYVKADKATLPYCYAFTAKDTWWNCYDSCDSDVNSSGNTDWIWLNDGEQQNHWDVGAYRTPIVLDLDGDGIETLGLDAGVTFDMDNDGQADATGWIGGDDAFLVVDANGNGQIDNQSEMFGGDAIGEGFAELAAYDSNNDGVVDLSDDAFANLLLWQDANQNGVTDAGELASLADFGIESLSLAYESVVGEQAVDANGNQLIDWSSAETADGKTIDMVDVYLASDSVNLNGVEAMAAAASPAAPDFSAMFSDDAPTFSYDAEIYSSDFNMEAIPEISLLGHSDDHGLV